MQGAGPAVCAMLHMVCDVCCGEQLLALLGGGSPKQRGACCAFAVARWRFVRACARI